MPEVTQKPDHGFGIIKSGLTAVSLQIGNLAQKIDRNTRPRSSSCSPSSWGSAPTPADHLLGLMPDLFTAPTSAPVRSRRMYGGVGLERV
ncbi:hypothetical protein [Streptomyces goshikiensis]|uniref:hypothetical protein n=1 Tax=Streptomyces goshikiensis TaxID=1942 RepID=UPI0037236FBB